MTYNQKILVIAIFTIVYTLAAWLLLREDHAARVNFQACPLCEK